MFYQIFMVWKMKTLMYFYFNWKYFRGYGYYANDQKLIVFPLSLKGAALRWFMSLGGNCIQTWEDMKHVFLKRYQDYCRINKDIFKMT